MLSEEKKTSVGLTSLECFPFEQKIALKSLYQLAVSKLLLF